jgi:hypothetical protein
MDSPAPVSNRRKGLRIGFILVAALLVVALIAIIAPKKAAPEPIFAWLDQTQFSRQIRPGRLKRLYYKVVNFAAPVLQHFRRPKTQILIGCKFLAVHSPDALGIGAAMATNESGAQVWILSPSELDNLRQRLKTANGIEVVTEESITVADGTKASITEGSVTTIVPIGIGNFNSPSNAFIGVAVDVNPKIVSHEFQLAMSTVYIAMSTVYNEPNQGSFMDSALTNVSGIRTNISAACRVRLSNAGGVLISSPLSKDLNGTNYWLILSPTAVDGYGKPIKL